MNDGFRHVKIRPSSLARVNACTASLFLDILRPDDKAVFLPEAFMGTVIHKLAEKMLKGRTTWEAGTHLIQNKEGNIDVLPSELDMYLGENKDYSGVVTVSKEMLEAAGRYVSFINHNDAGAEYVHVEKHIEHDFEDQGGFKFSLQGTPDVIYFRDGCLHIIDLKTGKYPVEVLGNMQMYAYAFLGYLEYMDSGIDISEAATSLRLTIFQQDRDVLFEPVIRTLAIEWQTVHDYVTTVMKQLVNSLSVTTAQLDMKLQNKTTWDYFYSKLEYTPGGHCGFCPHLTTCKAQKARMEDFAKSDFVIEDTTSRWDLGAWLDLIRDVERNAKYMRSIITKAALEDPQNLIPEGYEIRERRPEGWKTDEERAARFFLWENSMGQLLKLPTPSAVRKEAKKLTRDTGDGRLSNHIIKSMEELYWDEDDSKRVKYLAKAK